MILRVVVWVVVTVALLVIASLGQPVIMRLFAELHDYQNLSLKEIGLILFSILILVIMAGILVLKAIKAMLPDEDSN